MGWRGSLLSVIAVLAACPPAAGGASYSIRESRWRVTAPDGLSDWDKVGGAGNIEWRRSTIRRVKLRGKSRRVRISETLRVHYTGLRKEDDGTHNIHCYDRASLKRLLRGKHSGREAHLHRCGSWLEKGGRNRLFAGGGPDYKYDVEICRFDYFGEDRSEVVRAEIEQRWHYLQSDWTPKDGLPPLWRVKPPGYGLFRELTRGLKPKNGRSSRTRPNCDETPAREPIVTEKLKPVKPFGARSERRGGGILISRKPPPAPPPRAAPPKPKKKIDQDLLDRLLGKKSRKRVFTDLSGRRHVKEEGEKKPPLKEHSERFRADLLKDDQVREAYDRWGYMGDEERRRIMGRVAAIHARAYDVPPASLTFGDAKGAGGYYLNGGIVVDSGFDISDPDKAFNIVSHEATHHYQDELIARLKDGRIGPGHELYETARSFQASQSKYCCPTYDCKNRCSYEEYRGQANERHAFEEGEGAVQHLKSGVSRNTLEEYKDIIGGGG